MPRCFVEKPCDRIHPQLLWQERESFLLERGYSLPPLYHHIAGGDWMTPQFTERLPTFAESNTPAARAKGVCAIQNSTNRLVYIKRTPTFGKEFAMVLYLSAPPLLGDARNPHPTLIESFPDEEDERLTYMVMPYLRRVSEHQMKTVEDVLELGTQLLRGLRFLHDIQIMHRSLDASLIMMEDPYDSSPRTSKSQPKYYVLNFSKAYPSVDFLRRYQHLKHKKADMGAELRKDVRAVGSFLQTYFLDQYSNLSFLQPAVTRMMTMSSLGSYASLMEWAELSEKLRWFKRRILLRHKQDVPKPLARLAEAILRLNTKL